MSQFKQSCMPDKREYLNGEPLVPRNACCWAIHPSFNYDEVVFPPPSSISALFRSVKGWKERVREDLRITIDALLDAGWTKPTNFGSCHRSYEWVCTICRARDWLSFGRRNNFVEYPNIFQFVTIINNVLSSEMSLRYWFSLPHCHCGWHDAEKG